MLWRADGQADLDSLDRDLRLNVEALVEHLRGQHANEKLSHRGRGEIRFGSKGALSVALHGDDAGRITDFADDGKGRSPLAFIKSELSCSWSEAISWAREWLGEPSARVEVRPQLVASTPRAKADNRSADRIYATSLPIVGTPAEKYLIGRGITEISAQELRFHPAVRVRDGIFPALLVVAGRGGTIHRVQAVLLTSEGGRACDEQGKKRPKQTFGAGAGHIPAILPGDDTIVEVEGPEDGLSIWQATGHTVAISFGAGNLGKAIYAASASIIVAGDNDQAGRDAVARAVASYTTAGHSYRAVFPPDGVKDFNELLVASGNDAVRAAIDGLTAPTPIDEIGVEVEAGPRSPISPAPDPAAPSVDTVRHLTEVAISTMIQDVLAYRADLATWEAEIEVATPGSMLKFRPQIPRRAVVAPTAIGKSAMSRKLISRLREAVPGAPIVVMAPTIRLCEDAAQGARRAGNDAVVVRGRTARRHKFDNQPSDWVIPESAKLSAHDVGTMCIDPDAPEDALNCIENVMESVCRRKKNGTETLCEHYNNCPYITQNNAARTADVIYMAHQHIFQDKPEFIKAPSLVIIDESFFQAGLDTRGRTILCDELLRRREIPGKAGSVDIANTIYLSEANSRLSAAILASQGGPLLYSAICDVRMSEQMARDARSLVWKLKLESGITPGLNRKERKERRNKVEVTNKEVAKLAKVWEIVADMIASQRDHTAWIKCQEIECKDGSKSAGAIINCRKEIRDAWHGVPTLFLDATFRSELVSFYYPNVKVIKIPYPATPHQTITQILGSPNESNKWSDHNSAKHHKTSLNNRVRWQRLIQVKSVGCRHMLVICQKDLQESLEKLGIPENVELAHFNATRGVDKWGPKLDGDGNMTYPGVDRLLIIGRTFPGPHVVEMMSEALTGVVTPTRLPGWYPKIEGGSEFHPDTVSEAIRWSIPEAETVQCVGRGRGLNRTDANPIVVEIYSDLSIPIPVDRTLTWAEVSRTDVMAAHGVVLRNATDMSMAFPGLWPTVSAARHEQERSTPNALVNTPLKAFGALLVEYRPLGAGQKARRAIFDLARIPNPSGWMESRLGTLAKYEVVATIQVLDGVSVWITLDGRRWFREPTELTTAPIAVEVKPEPAPQVEVEPMLRRVNVGREIPTGLVVGKVEIPEQISESGWIGWRPTLIINPEPPTNIPPWDVPRTYDGPDVPWPTCRDEWFDRLGEWFCLPDKVA